MSQHDLTIDNQGFPAFRADLNNALQALGSTQSGTSAPSPTFANQLWYDTTNNQLKIRNEDNDAWITLLTLDQSADSVSQLATAIAVLSAGTAGAPALTTSGDTNTGVFFPAADTTAFAQGGTERKRITSGGYTKMSNSGTYSNASGSYHEFYNDGNTETVVIRNANASFGQEVVVINADRNTSNNSYYFLRGNVPGVGTRFLVADSGAIGSAGGISLGNVTPPTSGIGVQFPASQSASSDANTLDDYEEGTFTPTIIGTSTAGTASYGRQSGIYTKIGNRVFFTIALSWASGTGTGNLAVAGLPFTQDGAGLDIPYAISENGNIAWSANYYGAPIGLHNTTTIYVNQSRVGGSAPAANTAYDNSGDLSITGHYRIA